MLEGKLRITGYLPDTRLTGSRLENTKDDTHRGSQILYIGYLNTHTSTAAHRSAHSHSHNYV